MPGRDEFADANKAPTHSETTMRGATDAGGIVAVDRRSLSLTAPAAL
ncbi:MAG TPA: hypothetical protein VNG89_13515 [Vicinamibacterales bacterium]|nr:hypothetical protein [Vicinamibacterales bacterium]